MTRTVERPADITGTLQRRGRTYKRANISTDRKELSNYAKKLKKSNSNLHYLIKSYKNVKVRSGPFGNYKRKKVYALFISR